MRGARFWRAALDGHQRQFGDGDGHEGVRRVSVVRVEEVAHGAVDAVRHETALASSPSAERDDPRCHVEDVPSGSEGGHEVLLELGLDV